jgi:hypothetical protein
VRRDWPPGSRRRNRGVGSASLSHPWTGVDETLIISSLDMTPGERLERFEREYAWVREFALEVQPQVAREVIRRLRRERGLD